MGEQHARGGGQMPVQAGRHLVKGEKVAQALKGFEEEEPTKGSDCGLRRALNKREVVWRGGVKVL